MAVRTFTHLYDNYDEAVQTVSALEAAGVPHDDISLVANNTDSRHDMSGTTTTTGISPATADAAETGAGTGATLGTVLGGGAGLLTGLGLLAIPGVGPVVAAGWLVATLTGAGVGASAGGLLGSLMGAGVPADHAHTYTEGVRRGGTLVTVRADEAQAARIEEVLNGRAGSFVNVASRRSEYETEGWTGHEPGVGVLTPEEIAAERSRRSV